MTLPFDNSDKNQRKWQCFVCGKEHTSFEEYKDHIISTHKEGREYVKCPVESCQSPVRCLKTHFKMKHPSRILPKGLQDKAIIWHDFTTQGKKKTRKPTFRSGEFDSKKNGRMIPYRSGMECKVYECLENLDNVLSYKEEPFKIPYYYIDSKTKTGEWKEYIPDLRVNFTDGSTEIWEIKPANQTSLEQNECKWTAMNRHAEQYDWEFKVITEVGLGKLQKQLKEQRDTV